MITNMSEYDFIINLITEAGELLRQKKQEKFSISFKGDNPKDIVTSLDTEIGQFITDKILAVYPDHTIYNEEADTLQGSDFEWAIDPIDGSASFARDLPHYAISIGLSKAGVPVVGAVLDVMTGELFSFRKGEGVFLNGEHISVSNRNDLSTSFILLAAGRKEDQVEWAGESYKKLLRSVNKVKNFGSSALSLCYVAAGRIEGVVAGTLSTKDITAAVGILNEAGGKVLNVSGEPAPISSHPDRLYIAHSEKLARDLITLLESN
jgi:myo-inositol-1(or 4)-monophosphatase